MLHAKSESPATAEASGTGLNQNRKATISGDTSADDYSCHKVTGLSSGKSATISSYIKALILNALLSIIPANVRTKNPTLSEWKCYQAKRMPVDIAAKHKWPGVAIICGAVSGHLEILDFDFMAVWFDPWAALVEAEKLGLIAKLTRQKTQSGGKHIVFRCPGVDIPGNTKLASDKIEVDGPGDHEFMGKIHRAHNDGDRWFIYPCYIETRGEGGYFLAAPTAGYSLENGSFLDLPEITPEERHLLIKAAKALDRAVRPK